MKGTFFSKPLEWNLETIGEAWQQGAPLKGTLKVKNHGAEAMTLKESGVAIGVADIKKIHARAEGAMKPEQKSDFGDVELKPNEEKTIEFTFTLNENAYVTDKKSSYYLSFGKNFSESQLQLKIEPRQLFGKIIGLLDTFHRFKLKEYKGAKKGVEYKLLPPTARDMANIESLLLTMQMDGETLVLKFDFQVKKLDTSSTTTKINKESATIERRLTPKEYSLGRDMINQDQLLKITEAVLSEVKIKAVF